LIDPDGAEIYDIEKGQALVDVKGRPTEGKAVTDIPI
jgi:hypothetical protein